MLLLNSAMIVGLALLDWLAELCSLTIPISYIIEYEHANAAETIYRPPLFREPTSLCPCPHGPLILWIIMDEIIEPETPYLPFQH